MKVMRQSRNVYKTVYRKRYVRTSAKSTHFDRRF